MKNATAAQRAKSAMFFAGREHSFAAPQCYSCGVTGEKEAWGGDGRRLFFSQPPDSVMLLLCLRITSPNPSVAILARIRLIVLRGDGDFASLSGHGVPIDTHPGTYIPR